MDLKTLGLEYRVSYMAAVQRQKVSTNLLRHVLKCKISLVIVNDRLAEAMSIIQNMVALAYYLQLLLS